jgi:allantoin racemase
MARVLLINPNSSAHMTDAMAAAVRPVLAQGSSLLALTAAYGPQSIEGYYDEVFAIPPMLEALREHEGQFDGVVIGCFDDTGVDAARCVTRAPVVGICQAGMQAAASLASSFSVITTLGRSVPALEHLAVKYGYERACKRIRASEVPVLELENTEGDAARKVRDQVRAALEEDHAEAIVLGCAGMTTFARRLEEDFGVPVIDGVGVAAKWVEALSTLGYRTSTANGYAPPRPKNYAGLFERYTP